MKITRRQIKMIIEAYGDNPEDINFQIAMKIKDMMPAEEAINMRDQDFEDLMVSVYEQHFDETNEGWAPYPEDIEEIRSHLTIRDY